jgi:hypothetical protein
MIDRQVMVDVTRLLGMMVLMSVGIALIITAVTLPFASNTQQERWIHDCRAYTRERDRHAAVKAEACASHSAYVCNNEIGLTQELTDQLMRMHCDDILGAVK